MGKTSIEWTQVTWNPTVGCDRISPGCARCYAKDLHDRRHKAFLAGKDVAPQYAQPFEVLQLMETRLDVPLRTRTPTTFFVNSVSDLFHEDVPDDFIDRVFAVMARASKHTFQILTKRSDRMRQYVASRGGRSFHVRMHAILDNAENEGSTPEFAWPLPNVWLGVSVENQHFADERIPLLLQTPAAVRFISAEPLLGPVLLDNGTHSWLTCTSSMTEERYEALTPFEQGEHCCCERWDAMGAHFHGLDWIIVGGESGTGARTFDLAWARSIVQQCHVAGVPVFVKQLGARPFGLSHHPDQGSLVLRDRKGGDPSEWPEDLRVRQFPEVARG